MSGNFHKKNACFENKLRHIVSIRSKIRLIKFYPKQNRICSNQFTLVGFLMALGVLLKFAGKHLCNATPAM